jgi:hypothetical protein
LENPVLFAKFSAFVAHKVLQLVFFKFKLFGCFTSLLKSFQMVHSILFKLLHVLKLEFCFFLVSELLFGPFLCEFGIVLDGINSRLEQWATLDSRFSQAVFDFPEFRFIFFKLELLV